MMNIALMLLLFTSNVRYVIITTRGGTTLTYLKCMASERKFSSGKQHDKFKKTHSTHTRSRFVAEENDSATSVAGGCCFVGGVLQGRERKHVVVIRTVNGEW